VSPAAPPLFLLPTQHPQVHDHDHDRATAGMATEQLTRGQAEPRDCGREAGHSAALRAKPGKQTSRGEQAAEHKTPEMLALLGATTGHARGGEESADRPDGWVARRRARRRA
jgi:hypothetical protein